MHADVLVEWKPTHSDVLNPAIKSKSHLDFTTIIKIFLLVL